MDSTEDWFVGALCVLLFVAGILVGYGLGWDQANIHYKEACANNTGFVIDDKAFSCKPK